MCRGGPEPPPVGYDTGECWTKPGWDERRPFQWPRQQLHHLKAEPVLSSSVPWLLEKLWHRVHLLFAPDGLVDHKTSSKNTVTCHFGGHFNPPFISLPFWSSRPLTHKLGRRSVPGKAAFWHGFCSFYFFNRLCFKTEFYKNHSRGSWRYQRSMFSAMI